MGKGNFKGKPKRGERKISSADEIRMREREEPKIVEQEEEEEEEESVSEEETDEVLKVENPNWGVKLTVKAKDADMEKTTELSRREREELEKQRLRRRHLDGKSEQARKDLERLTLLRQERADAAKKREEEKAAREDKKKKDELLRK